MTKRQLKLAKKGEKLISATKGAVEPLLFLLKTPRNSLHTPDSSHKSHLKFPENAL